MKRPPVRPLVLLAAGIAAAVAAGPLAAEPGAIAGAVSYEGGAAIPEGRLEIYLEDLAASGPGARSAPTRIASGGKSTEIPFSLPASAARGTGSLEIVARLERADGWLLARGSAPYDPGSPVRVTLNTVMY